MIQDIAHIAFSDLMGNMSIVPFFGGAYNKIYPIFIGVYCLFTTFNLYSTIARALGISKKFQYESKLRRRGSIEEEQTEGQRMLQEVLSFFLEPLFMCFN